MKAYTDLNQSKKLAEILLMESADMCWQQIYDENHMMSDYRVESIPYRLYSGIGIPCWSLAALYSVLPTFTLDSSDDHYFRLSCNKRTTEWYDNAIDACYEMIIRLNELKML